MKADRSGNLQHGSCTAWQLRCAAAAVGGPSHLVVWPHACCVPCCAVLSCSFTEVRKDACFILGLLAVKPEYQHQIAKAKALPGRLVVAAWKAVGCQGQGHGHMLRDTQHARQAAGRWAGQQSSRPQPSLCGHAALQLTVAPCCPHALPAILLQVSSSCLQPTASLARRPA